MDLVHVRLKEETRPRQECSVILRALMALMMLMAMLRPAAAYSESSLCLCCSSVTNRGLSREAPTLHVKQAVTKGKMAIAPLLPATFVLSVIADFSLHKTKKGRI